MQIKCAAMLDYRYAEHEHVLLAPRLYSTYPRSGLVVHLVIVLCPKLEPKATSGVMGSLQSHTVHIQAYFSCVHLLLGTGIFCKGYAHKLALDRAQDRSSSDLLVSQMVPPALLLLSWLLCSRCCPFYPMCPLKHSTTTCNNTHMVTTAPI